MPKRFRMVVLGIALAAISRAEPRVTRIANNYSLLPAGLPNSGIAPGSIFLISGEDLSANSASLQTLPLATTLADTEVSIAVADRVVQAILYAVSPSSILAVLPSTTPVGRGQITVTSRGQTSPAARIDVVPGAFGILTLNQAGAGPAAAFDAKGKALSLTSSAGPGDTITLWGSGLGPALGDETIAPSPVDLVTIPIDVQIGGLPAEVRYHGRAGYPGLDQIDVVVPARVYPGCYVSVVVRTADTVSNFTTIPVSATGSFCGDVHTGFSGIQIAFKSVVNIAEIEFGLESTASSPYRGLERFYASFRRYTPDQMAAKPAGTHPSYGSCVVYSFTGSMPKEEDRMQYTALNAGTVGFRTKPAMFRDGAYSLSGGPELFAGEQYRIENASGGPDVGPFQLSMAIAGSGGHGDALKGGAGVATWTSMDSTNPISRSQGVTLRWRHSQNLDNFIQVSGMSVAEGESGVVGAVFYCTALNNDEFTVPPAVLLAMPVSTPVTIDGVKVNLSTLSLATYGELSSPYNTFRAGGIDMAYVSGYARAIQSMEYR